MEGSSFQVATPAVLESEGLAMSIRADSAGGVAAWDVEYPINLGLRPCRLTLPRSIDVHMYVRLGSTLRLCRNVVRPMPLVPRACVM